MPSILIADDHAMIRTGLRQYLERDCSIDVIGEAASGAETLQGLRDRQWDLVILDINMPDGNGIDTLRKIRLEHPNAKVLVVSGYAENQYAVNVLRAGAAGYLAKDEAPEEFLRAVHTVLAGRRFVTESLRELLLSELDEPTDRPMHTSLSQREFQVLSKLAVGQSVSEIASELAISVKTVSTYRARVLEKMHLETNADLTTYALRNGLLQ
jgi:two-component system, NarL family, invasion response regulator UvrY